MMDNKKNIIIFDGVCHFCNGAVNFIIRRDPNNVFVFAPMQSQLAQELTNHYDIDQIALNTFVLIKDGQCFIRTNAALEITKDMPGLWCLLNIFRIIPRPIRDACYSFLAKHRYRLFGRRATCMLPTVEVKNRFVGI